MDLSEKQQQFNSAMENYHARPIYKYFGLFTSLTNVSLQVYLLIRILPLSIGGVWQLVSIIVAYLFADFINGLVHMYMDNNDRYDSLDGPMIANFHLHHMIPKYRKHNLLVIYVVESGSKVWLAGYLLLIAFLLGMFELNPVVAYMLVYIGILSSCAEVSHYLCHTSTSAKAGFLASFGLLLSKRHHARHHLQDNCCYAFLNGVSDPLLNLIAAACCKGYKHNTDLHYEGYLGPETDNR